MDEEADFTRPALRWKDYEGREQSYAKHLMLAEYLRVLAYKVLLGWKDKPFVFVDGFSGPWRSGTADRSDTSPHRCLTVLSDVVTDIRAMGANPDVRAIFVEEKRAAHAELTEAVRRFPLVSSTVHRGRFQELVPRIAGEVGDAFAFVFVDPTGWTGMDLPNLRPLLLHRNREVLVNLMSYAVNRFVTDERSTVRSTFHGLFGGDDWLPDFEERRRSGLPIEEAVRLTYLDRLRRTCGFPRVTTTRILWPGKDRTYFHLAYGTHSPKGIRVFRKAEEKCVAEQEHVQHDARLKAAAERTGMVDLFAEQEGENDVAFRAGREAAREGLRQDVETWLSKGLPGRRDDVFATWMERPLAWVKDCREAEASAIKAGRLIRDGSGRDAVLRPIASSR